MLKLTDIQQSLESPQQTIALLEQAKNYAIDYRHSLFSREVYPTPQAIAALTQFSEPLPKDAADPAAMLELLHSLGSPATVAQTGGRYFGFVSGTSTATLLYLQQSGICWCGGTNWKDEPVIRVSVCSWLTTHEDITRSVDAFVAARNKAGDVPGPVL